MPEGRLVALLRALHGGQVDFIVVGGLAARSESHTKVWRILGVEPPETTVAPGHSELYDDALPALGALRAAGFRVGVAGNMPAPFKELTCLASSSIRSSSRFSM